MARAVAIAVTVGTLAVASGSAGASPFVTAATAPVIVFEGPIKGGAGNHVVRLDGTGDRWLTPDVPLRPGGWQVHPDWSPDGKRLAFAADSDADTRDIWVTAAGGTGAVRVLDCSLPCIEADYPSWSPDGKKLAFEAFDGRGKDNVNARLSVLNLASRKLQTVYTATRVGDLVRTPRWSPDGQRLVFEIQHWSNGGPTGTLVNTEIDVKPANETGHAKRLTRPSLLATYPDWSWTSDRIVFSTRPWSDLPLGPSNLYTIAPDGSHLRAVTRFAAGATRATQPSWTPTGDRIIFTAVKGKGFGAPTMATIRPDGSGLTSATTSGPMFGTHPRLRPTSNH